MKAIILDQDPSRYNSVWSTDDHITIMSRLSFPCKQAFDIAVVDFDDPCAVQTIDRIRSSVMFATSKSSAEFDVAKVLEIADDWMARPVRHVEMRARISKLVRPVIEYQHVTLHIDSLQAYAFGKPVRLTRKEFQLAAYLLRHKTIDRMRTHTHVWGAKGCVTRTVDTHVSRLRRKLAIKILARYGNGYALEQKERDLA